MAIINGTPGNDNLTGTTESDRMSGLAGNDTLQGGVGNDTLTGGDGDDSLSGGDGYDVLKAYGGTQNGISESDTLTGGQGSDLFDLTDAGNSPAYLNDDVLNPPGKGFAVITDFNSILTSAEGDKLKLGGDAAHYRILPVSWGQKFGNEDTATTVDLALTYIGPEQDKNDVVAVLQDVSALLSQNDGLLRLPNITAFDPNYQHPTPVPNPGSNPNPGSGSNPDPGSPNRIVGTPAADNLQGTGAADIILGLESNDTLDGGTGVDSLLGGLGDDTYIIDTVNDQIAESFNQGIDTVRAAFSYTIGQNLENLALTGSDPIEGTGNELNNTLIGNAANNKLTGLVGDDTLNGGIGADTLIGGLGNDTYVVDAAGDLIGENVNEGTDLVQSSVSYTLAANLENLILTGTDNINGTGNELNNILIGNAGVNTLDGGIGNDTLMGSTGKDSLRGGSGADRFVFGSPTDRVDRVLDFSRQESDKLIFVANGPGSFERVRLGRVKKNQFVVGKRAGDKNDRFVYNEDKGVLFYDRDGRGGVGQVRIATFADQPTLGAKDLLVAASPF